jgi:arylformamidase
VASTSGSLAAYHVGPPAHDKGPTVFLDYDQIELDAAYDQAVYAPQREEIIGRLTALSDTTRTRLGTPERHTYGPTPPEHLDIYRAPGDRAPVFMFVHGGAWKTADAHRNAFVAELFVRAGVHCVLLEFTGVETVDGNLRMVHEQVCRGIGWVIEHCGSFGGDPQRLFVGGHSSGAHLAGAAVARGLRDLGMAAESIKGALLCSGMYELSPVRLSKRSGYVHFDDALVDDLSTIRHLKSISAPIVLAYGTQETPEFQRQTREFYDAMIANGKDARLIVAQGYNHFDIVETLGNPYGLLGRAALQMIQAV